MFSFSYRSVTKRVPLSFLDIALTIYTQFFDFLEVNSVGHQNSKFDLSFAWMNFRHKRRMKAMPRIGQKGLERHSC